MPARRASRADGPARGDGTGTEPDVQRDSAGGIFTQSMGSAMRNSRGSGLRRCHRTNDTTVDAPKPWMHGVLARPPSQQAGVPSSRR